MLTCQGASLSIDLRSRQQQVDTMRGELQAAGKRSAAERQQSESQAEMLMEQLAIAQAAKADPKVTLILHGLSCLHTVVKRSSVACFQSSVQFLDFHVWGTLLSIHAVRLRPWEVQSGRLG